jgi:endonuclease-3 related protein
MRISQNMNKILPIYNILYKSYGPQGWWPINNRYHKNDFSYPKNNSQKFEICIGAILTQNTSWKNVEKALVNLKKLRLLDAQKIINCDNKKITGAIRPAGYFNQKAKKLKIFAKFYCSLKGTNPSRNELLDLWGVGPETADSILLYAYRQPEFIVDSYTKRLLMDMKITTKKYSYEYIKELFEKNLPKDHKLFQEFHALIVENGKNIKK